jgi:beta-phosphoglucomutase-like phosphatase (HAD superfamily)
MISHVIFDCDGVLIDSEVISMDVDIALLAQSGIHLTAALSAPPLKTW